MPKLAAGEAIGCREAKNVCPEDRTSLGGNVATLKYSPLRHANNLEPVRTYEGIDEVHTLILGNKLAGIPAFG